jgi:hypothetical protein
MNYTIPNPFTSMISAGTKGPPFSSTQMRKSIGQQSIKSIPQYNLKEERIKETYEMLIRRLYGLPIPKFTGINGIPLIFFPELFVLSIIKFDIDPVLQPWTLSPNSIITLYLNDGRTVVVEAQYNHLTNQILAPAKIY